MTDATETFEIKATPGPFGGDTADKMNTFAGMFEEYKRTNDQRLLEVERRGSADPLHDDKLARLTANMDGNKSSIDRDNLNRARPRLEGGEARQTGNPEYKDAFSAYVKRGEEKALSIGSNPDGGYLVPVETETEINRLLTSVSPIRSLASVQQISTSVYKKPITIVGTQVGWAAETAIRPQTNSQTIDAVTFATFELYAQPAATAQFLDDAAVDVGQWIANEVNTAFAIQEGAAFVTGDGTSKPKGFLSAPQVADASWAWNSVGYLSTGVATGLPASNPSDILVDLVYALKAGYRQNGTGLMNRKSQAALRKLKDADGNYLWQPAAAPNGNASLMGFPLVECEDMPDIAAGNTPIAFGDFRRGYLIVDRMGVNVLRDPFTAKPYVLFYTTKRVGGSIQDFAAIKLLKIATS
jgi:HK97 family phage major capsid protein